MGRRRSAKGLVELEQEFMGKAKEAFDRMFGSDGQNGLVAFTQREDRACEATDVLARWLMEKHLDLDPAGDPGVKVDCPICGGPVEYGSAGEAEMEIREFQTRRGKVEYQRAGSRCPRCRRIFFPA